MGRFIGLDVHRTFAQVAVVEDGLCRDEGRIGVTPEDLRIWSSGLLEDDQVALEATGNSDAIAMLLEPLVPGWWCATRERSARSRRPR